MDPIHNLYTPNDLREQLQSLQQKGASLRFWGAPEIPPLVKANDIKSVFIDENGIGYIELTSEQGTYSFDTWQTH